MSDNESDVIPFSLDAHFHKNIVEPVEVYKRSRVILGKRKAKRKMK
jgi:hypothetical protein